MCPFLLLLMPLTVTLICAPICKFNRWPLIPPVKCCPNLAIDLHASPLYYFRFWLFPYDCRWMCASPD